MALFKDRVAKNGCILCGNDVEKSNLGSMCNPCKDKMYKYPFAASKTAAKVASKGKS